MDDVTERSGGASGQARGRVSNRAIASAALAVAVFVAGCNSRAGNPASPSAAGGAPEAHNGSDRFFKAAISPISVTAGSAETYTVRVTNCDAGACSSGSHSGTGQSIKSATIAVPAGFTVDGSNLATNLSIAGAWNAVLDGSTIKLSKGDGNDNLPPGAWVEVTFHAIAPCTGGSYTWTTAAFNGDDFTTPYSLFGTQPSVTVTGSCAAQACSPGFWKQDQHFDDWPNPPATTDLFQTIFGRLITVNQQPDPAVTGPTLLQALNATGGDVNRIARIGTAAYLSAAHPDVAYPYSTAQVVLAVQQAIDGATFTGPSIDDLENVWKNVEDHCPLGSDTGGN